MCRTSWCVEKTASEIWTMISMPVSNTVAPCFYSTLKNVVLLKKLLAAVDTFDECFTQTLRRAASSPAQEGEIQFARINEEVRTLIDKLVKGLLCFFYPQYTSELCDKHKFKPLASVLADCLYHLFLDTMITPDMYRYIMWA